MPIKASSAGFAKPIAGAVQTSAVPFVELQICVCFALSDSDMSHTTDLPLCLEVHHIRMSEQGMAGTFKFSEEGFDCCCARHVAPMT
jgi:hypothetical protein